MDGYSFKNFRKASSRFACAMVGHNGVPGLTTLHALMWATGSFKHCPFRSIIRLKVYRKAIPNKALFTSVTIKMWVYVLHKPKFNSIHFSTYVCISKLFTTCSINLQGIVLLYAAVTDRRKICAPLSTKKGIPVALLVA